MYRTRSSATARVSLGGTGDEIRGTKADKAPSGIGGPRDVVPDRRDAFLAILEFSRKIGTGTSVATGLNALSVALGAEGAQLVTSARRDARDDVLFACTSLAALCDKDRGSWARLTLGVYAGKLMVGATYSLARDGESGRQSPELSARLARIGFHDIAIVVLSSGSDTTEYLEILFRDPAEPRILDALAEMAPLLVHCWSERDPASTVVALQRPRRRLQQADLDRSQSPILAVGNPAGLTRAEFGICQLVGRGLSIAGIVGECGLTIATVRTHLRNIYAKTECDGFHELAVSLISGGRPSVSAGGGRRE